MKRVFAIIGTALLAALGLLLPRFAAAFQDRNLSGDVWQMENAAVSLTLAQEMVELDDLDLFQSLKLFSSPATMVELEEGRYTSEEDAAQKARWVAAYLMTAVYYNSDAYHSQEIVPFLRTDMDGRSGIFWRCSWKGRPDEVVWIDDQNGTIMGFILRNMDPAFEDPILYSNFDVLCNLEFSADPNVYVLDEEESCVIIINTKNDEEKYTMPIYNTDEYLYFNMQFVPAAY